MAHFAKVENGIVTEVLVIEQDVIDTGAFGDSALWVQTSYNTYGGQHPEGRPLRKNYAGIGYTYDAERDAFIPPSPFPSWVIDDATCLWVAPLPYPDDGKPYTWDEAQTQWVLKPIPEQPFASWALNEATHDWIAPVPYPDDGKPYRWDEATLAWVEVTS